MSSSRSCTPHLGSLTVILRGGDRRYRDELKKFLDNLFDGTGAPAKPRAGEIEMLEERLRAADAELAELTSEIRAILEREARWTRYVAEFAAHPARRPTTRRPPPAWGRRRCKPRATNCASWMAASPAVRLESAASDATRSLGDLAAQLGLDDAAIWRIWTQIAAARDGARETCSTSRTRC